MSENENEKNDVGGEADKEEGIVCREENITPDYATLLIADHNEHNFLLDFAQKLPVGPYGAEVVARVAIPVSLLDEIICVLQDQRQRYKELYGEQPLIVSRHPDGGSIDE